MKGKGGNGVYVAAMAPHRNKTNNAGRKRRERIGLSIIRRARANMLHAANIPPQVHTITHMYARVKNILMEVLTSIVEDMRL